MGSISRIVNIAITFSALGLLGAVIPATSHAFTMADVERLNDGDFAKRLGSFSLRNSVILRHMDRASNRITLSSEETAVVRGNDDFSIEKHNLVTKGWLKLTVKGRTITVTRKNYPDEVAWVHNGPGELEQAEALRRKVVLGFLDFQLRFHAMMSVEERSEQQGNLTFVGKAFPPAPGTSTAKDLQVDTLSLRCVVDRKSQLPRSYELIIDYTRRQIPFHLEVRTQITPQ